MNSTHTRSYINTYATRMQDVSKDIVKACGGSVLAVEVMASYIRNKGSPQQWQEALDQLSSIFDDVKTDNYSATVFGALELAVASLTDAERDVMLALEPFRAGVPIPPSLIQLAVQQVTGDPCPEARLTFLLGKLCNASLLAYLPPLDVVTSAGREGAYILTDLVAMFVSESRYVTPAQRASQVLFGDGSASARTDQRELLAAYLAAFGKQISRQMALSYISSMGVHADVDLTNSTRFAAHLASEVADRKAPQVLASLLARRADMKRLQAKYAEALEDFNLACRLDPASAFNFQGRGMVYRRQGKLEQALEDLNTAHKLEPDNALILNSRGEIRLQMGDDAGHADLDQAARYGQQGFSSAPLS